jgi:hypothetical protein
MFCRNCGKELTGAPEFCMSCGAKPMAGTSFCPGCGAPTTPMTEVCTNCGTRVAEAMKMKTWMPTTAGILCIIAGAICVIFCIVVVVLGRSIGAFFGFEVVWEWSTFAIPSIILGTIAIVGGIFALKRKVWWLALVGAICAIIGPAGILGILAIIFVVMGRSEFE